MIKVGDKVTVIEMVFPEDDHLVGSIVTVLAKDDYTEEELEFEEEMVFIEFADGTTMDVEIECLLEIEEKGND